MNNPNSITRETRPLGYSGLTPKQIKKMERQQAWGRRMDIVRIILAIFVIITGIVCLLNNLGYTHITLNYAIDLIWPVLLIVFGVTLMINYDHVVMLGLGFLTMLAGILFLVNNSGLMPIDFRFVWNIMWPLVVIFTGAYMLFGGRSEAEPPAQPVPPLAPVAAWPTEPQPIQHAPIPPISNPEHRPSPSSAAGEGNDASPAVDRDAAVTANPEEPVQQTSSSEPVTGDMRSTPTETSEISKPDINKS